MKFKYLLIFFFIVLTAGCTKQDLVPVEQVVAVMEDGGFEEAVDMLEPRLGFFSRDAKANYVMAVALVRKDPPEMKKAIRYRKKAERLGYVIPEWFDNYVTKLENTNK